MSVMARQFGGPSGIVGWLVTRGLERGNAELNRRVVSTVSSAVTHPTRVVEIGCGPGVGLNALLSAYPQAQVIGVDRSDVVLAAARRRNKEALGQGRLTLVEGDVSSAGRYQPIDVAIAVHVLYFWPEPVDQLRLILSMLAPGGTLAIGYELRSNMPKISQRNFPKEGFRLFDSDDEVSAVFDQAGFRNPALTVFDTGGRVAIATRK
jgi:trans-aconitate methyltransferase